MAACRFLLPSDTVYFVLWSSRHFISQLVRYCSGLLVVVDGVVSIIA